MSVKTWAEQDHILPKQNYVLLLKAECKLLSNHSLTAIPIPETIVRPENSCDGYSV